MIVAGARQVTEELTPPTRATTGTSVAQAGLVGGFVEETSMSAPNRGLQGPRNFLEWRAENLRTGRYWWMGIVLITGMLSSLALLVRYYTLTVGSAILLAALCVPPLAIGIFLQYRKARRASHFPT